MRAEFMPVDQPDGVVGSAVWDGTRVVIDAGGDDTVAQALWRIFRPTAVAVDDPALRTAGTGGLVVLVPGSLRWFQAAARARAETEGLKVRFVADAARSMGWDPAGAYRPFAEVVERMVTADR
jgi:hypothetical protein